MYHKALYFNDTAAQSEIMKTSGPRKQKSLGSKVIGYDVDKWSKIRSFVMRQGGYLKFTQNESLKEVLLNTGNMILVEASPFDRVWGIGFRENVALQNRNDWGLNLLGKALMRVRERIRKEDNGEVVSEEEWRNDLDI